MSDGAVGGAEAEPGVGIARTQPHGLQEGGHRVLEPSLLAAEDGEVVPGGGVAAVGADRLAVGRDRFVELAALFVEARELEPRPRPAGPEPQRSAAGSGPLPAPAGVLARGPEAPPRLAEGRPGGPP